MHYSIYILWLFFVVFLSPQGICNISSSSITIIHWIIYTHMEYSIVVIVVVVAIVVVLVVVVVVVFVVVCMYYYT